MMSLLEIKKILQQHKSRLSASYGVKHMAIFGSYSRGDETANSDIDILVDFVRSIGIEFIELADELESVLRKKVDLVSRKGIKPEYYTIIENELVYV